MEGGHPKVTLLDDLIAIAPPGLAGRQDIDWNAVENQLSFRLPSDYKALFSKYGPGMFSEYVYLGDIASNVPRYLGGVERTYSIIEQGRLKGPAYWIDLPLYPTPGGIFPWGHDDNGGELAWLPDTDDPDRWPVIATDGDCSGYDRFDMSVTEFILKWLNNEVSVLHFPEDVQPVRTPVFVGHE